MARWLLNLFSPFRFHQRTRALRWPRENPIMQAALLQSKTSHRRGVLYPLLVIAAISVIIFSAIGAASLAGWLPRANSPAHAPGPQKRSEQIERRTTFAPDLERVAEGRARSGDAVALPARPVR